MDIKRQKGYRLFLLVLVYLLVVLFNINAGLSSSEMTAQKTVLFSFGFALLFTQISIVDSKIVGKPLPMSIYWLVFIFYGFAVPICILRAHGRRGIKYIIIHLIGLLLVAFISLLVTSFINGTFYD